MLALLPPTQPEVSFPVCSPRRHWFDLPTHQVEAALRSFRLDYVFFFAALTAVRKRAKKHQESQVLEEIVFLAR